MDIVISWLTEHKSLLVSMGIATLVLFVISLLLLPWVISRAPVDYFKQTRTDEDWHMMLKPKALVRNIIGLIVVAAGIMMLILPGQGILAILVGIALMQFPGKHQLEIKFVHLPGVLSSMNWIRDKMGVPPLEI